MPDGLFDFMKGKKDDKKAPPPAAGPGGNPPPPAPGTPPPPGGMPPPPPPQGGAAPTPPPPGAPMPPPPGGAPPPAPGKPGMSGPHGPGGTVNKAEVEEIAESIVEEKWNAFNKELTDMKEWKDKTESRVDKLEQSLADVKSDLDNLHKAIVSKIGDYDKNLLDVGTEIKAMEKVFRQVLPTLTENVAELSRITRKVKSDKAPAKK